VAVGGFAALISYLRKAPIIVWERAVTIWAMVLCHIQLVVGILFYALRFKYWKAVSLGGNQTSYSEAMIRYWKYEHAAMMILGIVLVTVGRMLSKRAETEPGKQLRVAIFFLLALALFLFTIPWPGTEFGRGRSFL
jgi:hypothetical protein